MSEQNKILKSIVDTLEDLPRYDYLTNFERNISKMEEACDGDYVKYKDLKLLIDTLKRNI